MDAWSQCVSWFATAAATVAPDWPAAQRRQVRFGDELSRDVERSGRTSDEQVLALVAARGPMTTLELSLVLDCSPTTAYKRLRRLRDSGALAEALQASAA